ncbi:PIN domain nuclease [Pseudonocardia sp. MH-G8]|uniref:PIN domain nuclease n=1 Tax=Pseudonocardia sp. MH-G8 TaxID=1854588 RepID=UPI002100CE68|nr:PIN domain nuclease [Pseudonocardia sp. MH-G8]
MSAWLVDKSALVRMRDSPDSPSWRERIDRGLVRIATVTRLEVGFSARSGPDLRQAQERAPLAVMPVEYLTPAVEDRAVEVQLMLADRGMHRAPSVPDLVIAASAELAGLIVLHVDKDFELIAGVTGQPTERLRLPS